MRLSVLLGWLSVALVVIATAPWWLRMLNKHVIKTKDKRFLNFLKFLRPVHKAAGIALAALALYHGYVALGNPFRLHTGTLLYAALFLTAALGVVFYYKKDKHAFKGHKVMALASVVLFFVHLFWRNAIFQVFGVF